MKLLFNLFSSRWFFLTYVYLLILVAIAIPGTRSNFIYSFLQILIILIGSLFIWKKPAFNLENSFYGFVIIFLGFYPLIEFKREILYWSGGEIDSSYYIIASALVLISLFAFKLGSSVKINFKERKTDVERRPTYSHILLSRRTFFKCLIAMAIPSFYLLYAYDFNILALQLRGYGESLETVFIFEFFFLKPLIFNIVFFTLLLMIKQRSASFTKSIILIIFLVFFSSPLSMPRFLAFSLYVPLIFVLFDIYKRRDCSYINTVFFGMIFVFPLLDLFRWIGVDSSQTFQKVINIDYYFGGHFDAFQNFVRVIILDFHTYGQQTLGAIFFFVPRSIWTTKAEGSGFLLAENANLAFNNISTPLIAELYLDFSFLGIIFGFFLLGFIYKYIDNKFLKINKDLNGLGLIKLIAYAELICLQFYILRGNLLATVAYTSSIMVSIALVYGLFLIFNFRLRPSDTISKK